jgi:magnesium-transporting ATPase (P-type)
MVFDKTGTLTEDDLEVYGFCCAEERGDQIFFGPFY